MIGFSPTVMNAYQGRSRPMLGGTFGGSPGGGAGGFGSYFMQNPAAMRTLQQQTTMRPTTQPRMSTRTMGQPSNSFGPEIKEPPLNPPIKDGSPVDVGEPINPGNVGTPGNTFTPQGPTNPPLVPLDPEYTGKIQPPSGYKTGFTGEQMPFWYAGTDYGKQLNEMGYEKDARPYTFDPSAFQDPRYAGNQAMIANYLQSYGSRGTPTIDNLATMYQDAAMGRGPSIAEMSLNRSRDANIAAANAMAASGRGPMAARTAAYQTGQINQEAAGQTAIARLQEVEAARRGLAGVAGLQLQQQQLNDQMVQYFVGQGLSLDQAQQAARQRLEELRAEQHYRAQATQAGIGAGGTDTGAALGGAAITGAAAIGAAMLSDERAKREIKASPGEIRKFLDALKAYRYKYDTRLDTSGKERFGIMAQDLEKSKAGKSLVIDMKTTDGNTYKAVDTNMAVGTLLAAASDLHGRVKTLEAVKSYGAK